MDNLREGNGPDQWGDAFICPVEDCGCENVHLLSVDKVCGCDNYKAWDGRGDAVFIEMYCEWGHEWTLQIGEHKGYTYATNRIHEATHPNSNP